jgi:hypothetical protein
MNKSRNSLSDSQSSILLSNKSSKAVIKEISSNALLKPMIIEESLQLSLPVMNLNFSSHETLQDQNSKLISFQIKIKDSKQCKLSPSEKLIAPKFNVNLQKSVIFKQREQTNNSVQSNNL